jgi:hypothetical protein
LPGSIRRKLRAASSIAPGCLRSAGIALTTSLSFAIALGAGIASGSIALNGFGADLR